MSRAHATPMKLIAHAWYVLEAEEVVKVTIIIIIIQTIMMSLTGNGWIARQVTALSLIPPQASVTSLEQM